MHAPETALHLPADILTAVIAHARWCLPEEACGLIAVDTTGRPRMAYPLTNQEASPIRFTIDPGELFGAVSHAEAQTWEIGGVFHSHPAGPATLSSTDIHQAHDPAWFHLVVGLSPILHLRAWRIEGGRPVELTLH